MGTKVATYRPYTPGTLCFAGRDYQPVLKTELTAMNELLDAFLQGTSSGPDGVWATEHVEMLEHAQSSLLPALDAYEATLNQVKDCLFEHRYEFPELARRGLEYVRQSRLRVAEAATLLPQLRARSELAKWKEQQTKDQESERSNWCPAKPKGTPSPEVYFAMEDETGHTEWMFCDGTRVGGPAGQGARVRGAQGWPPGHQGLPGRLPAQRRQVQPVAHPARAQGRPGARGGLLRIDVRPALMQVLAMILAGGAGTRLDPLTRERAKPAVPFGGRYRIIDFCLSNFANSGVYKMKVLTQYKSRLAQQPPLARAGG